jgi:hypothetical protein
MHLTFQYRLYPLEQQLPIIRKMLSEPLNRGVAGALRRRRKGAERRLK